MVTEYTAAGGVCIPCAAALCGWKVIEYLVGIVVIHKVFRLGQMQYVELQGNLRCSNLLCKISLIQLQLS